MTQAEAVAWLRTRFPTRQHEGRGRPAAMDWAGAAEAIGMSVDNLMRKMQPYGPRFTRQDLLIVELRIDLERRPCDLNGFASSPVYLGASWDLTITTAITPRLMPLDDSITWMASTDDDV